MSLNGNGHTNGVIVHKYPKQSGHNPHHTKNLKKVTKKSLAEAAVAADGCPSKVAKMLNIHPTTAYNHLRKPEIKKLVLESRELALKKSGLKLTKAYQRVGEALDAKQTAFGKEYDLPDHDIRLKAAKIAHEIFTKDDSNEAGGRPIVMMPVVMVNGHPANYDIGD